MLKKSKSWLNVPFA